MTAPRRSSSVATVPLGGAAVSRPVTGFSSHHAAFTVPGVPMAWARARTNGAQFFTDPKRVKGKSAIALYGGIAMGSRPPFVGPIVLTITAHFPIPKSWPAWMKQAARARQRHPTGKPDWDNVGKLVSDALNGVVWVDDAQVVGCSVHKYYSDEPRTEVDVYEVITDEIIGSRSPTVRGSSVRQRSSVRKGA